VIETGDKLGVKNSDLRPSETITEFVSGCQKNYAYRELDVGDGRENAVCKVRSITLNYNALKMENFGVIKVKILTG